MAPPKKNNNLKNLEMGILKDEIVEKIILRKYLDLAVIMMLNNKLRSTRKLYLKIKKKLIDIMRKRRWQFNKHTHTKCILIAITGDFQLSKHLQIQTHVVR